MDPSNFKDAEQTGRSYFASVNITSKPIDPAGNGAKVDVSVVEAEGPCPLQTFAIKAQGVSEFSVTFQMHPPAASRSLQCNSDVGSNSTTQTRPPTPPCCRCTKIALAAPFVSSFANTPTAQVEDGEAREKDDIVLDESDVQTVMDQGKCSSQEAVKALKENKGDVINAIMSFKLCQY